MLQADFLEVLKWGHKKTTEDNFLKNVKVYRSRRSLLSSSVLSGDNGLVLLRRMITLFRCGEK